VTPSSLRLLAALVFLTVALSVQFPPRAADAYSARADAIAVGTPVAPEGQPRGDIPPAQEWAMRMVRQGNRLLVLTHARGLQVLDVTDPLHPVLTARFAVAGKPVALAVHGDTAYAVMDFVSTPPSLPADLMTTERPDSLARGQALVVDLAPTVPVLKARVDTVPNIQGAGVVQGVLCVVGGGLLVTHTADELGRWGLVDQLNFGDGTDRNLVFTQTTVLQVAQVTTNTLIMHLAHPQPDGMLQGGGTQQIVGSVLPDNSVHVEGDLVRVLAAARAVASPSYLEIDTAQVPPAVRSTPVALDQDVVAATLVEGGAVVAMAGTPVAMAGTPVALRVLDTATPGQAQLQAAVASVDQVYALETAAGGEAVVLYRLGTAMHLGIIRRTGSAPAVFQTTPLPDAPPVVVEQWPPARIEVLQNLPRVVLNYWPWAADNPHGGNLRVVDVTPTGPVVRPLLNLTPAADVVLEVNSSVVVAASPRSLHVLPVDGLPTTHALWRNTFSAAVLPDGRVVQLHGSRDAGNVILTVTGEDPQDPVAVGEVQLPVLKFAQLFMHGTNAWILGADDGFDVNTGLSAWRSRLVGVELADPAHPVVRAEQIILPGAAFHQDNFTFLPQWGQRAHLLGDALVVLQDEMVKTGTASEPSCGCAPYTYDTFSVQLTAQVIDLRNADAPTFTSTRVDEAQEVTAVRGVGTVLLMVVDGFRSASVGTRLWALDVANPSLPVVVDRGVLAAAAHGISPDGAAAFSQVQGFDSSGMASSITLDQHRLDGASVARGRTVSASGMLQRVATLSSTRAALLHSLNPAGFFDTPLALRLVDVDATPAVSASFLAVWPDATTLRPLDAHHVLLTSRMGALVIRLADAAPVVEASFQSPDPDVEHTLHNGVLLLPAGEAGVYRHVLHAP